MADKRQVRTAILRYLHQQETDDNTPLTELCEQLHVPIEEVVDALDWLEEQDFVEAKHLDRYTRLCQITYSGRQLVNESAKQKIPRQDGRHLRGGIHLTISPKIFLAKLPTTGSELFGREQELEILDNAWVDSYTHIISIVAWGGVGKTALVNEWLNRMERGNYRGAERVYGWSFYSQGTREDRQISADGFIFHALSWFGDPDPTQGSSWNRGVRLAGLIRQHRTLFILDGVEPLQYPPGEMQGRLRDQGLQALLKELARSQSGLCILTTRVAAKDLEHTAKSSVKRIFLEHLSPEAGAKLLETLGVKGTSAELQEMAKEFKGHALALNLLGKYLTIAHDGDIRKRDLIPHLTEEEEQGGHARRVMESYERWLSGTPELNILYMMGLFDRPAPGGAIEALKATPPIDGLTSKLHQLSPAKWQYAVKRLRDLRLLAEKNEYSSDTLDCHPLIREHFGEKLSQSNPAAWKEAHSRLYEYYKNLPDKYLPDTLEEMEPLFVAVAHGCQAGRYQEAYDSVYWERILRKGEGKGHYSTKKLGAFGIDLQALSNFFEAQWSSPISELKEKDKGKVLGLAGFRLRALGRLREARQAMELAIDVRIKQENWKGAAVTTGNLSELCLTMGDVDIAIKYAQQCVNFADLSGNGFERDSKRTVLADILHNAGKYKEAETLFIEAESMQTERLPGHPYLYSVQGFRFCDLLLSLRRYQEAENRAFQSLHKKSKPDGRLLDIALDKLSLGRSLMLQSQEKESDDFSQVEEYLKQAVEDFRNANTQHHLPRGLLAQAALYRLQHKFVKAWNNLEEMREIAERGDMRLYLADYYLEAGRLCLNEGKHEDARKHHNTAKTMIDEMGYHRRDKEVEELKAALKIE